MLLFFSLLFQLNSKYFLLGGRSLVHLHVESSSGFLEWQITKGMLLLVALKLSSEAGSLITLHLLWCNLLYTEAETAHHGNHNIVGALWSTQWWIWPHSKVCASCVQTTAPRRYLAKTVKQSQDRFGISGHNDKVIQYLLSWECEYVSYWLKTTKCNELWLKYLGVVCSMKE